MRTHGSYVRVQVRAPAHALRSKGGVTALGAWAARLSRRAAY
jgi:hypothetical protein